MAEAIGEAIRRRLPELRAQAESLMTEQCVIERPGPTAYNPDTHTDEPTWGHVYAGRCRVRPISGMSGAELSEIFGQEITTLAHAGTLPITVTGARAGDRLTITSADTDPGQVGRRYTLLAVSSGALAVARRFAATENQG